MAFLNGETRNGPGHTLVAVHRPLTARSDLLRPNPEADDESLLRVLAGRERRQQEVVHNNKLMRSLHGAAVVSAWPAPAGRRPGCWPAMTSPPRADAKVARTPRTERRDDRCLWSYEDARILPGFVASLRWSLLSLFSSIFTRPSHTSSLACSSTLLFALQRSVHHSP